MMEWCLQYTEDQGWCIGRHSREMLLKMRMMAISAFQMHDAKHSVLSKPNRSASQSKPRFKPFYEPPRKNPGMKQELSRKNLYRNQKLPQKYLFNKKEQVKRKAVPTYRPRATNQERISRLNPLASEFIPSRVSTTPSPLRRTENVKMDRKPETALIDFVSNLTESELKSRINAEFDHSNFGNSELNHIFTLFTETN